jgi:hypothetical protein
VSACVFQVKLRKPNALLTGAKTPVSNFSDLLGDGSLESLGLKATFKPKQSGTYWRPASLRLACGLRCSKLDIGHIGSRVQGFGCVTRPESFHNEWTTPRSQAKTSRPVFELTMENFLNRTSSLVNMSEGTPYPPL